MFPFKNQKYRLDIVYPNKMYGGVYSLGPLIVYNLVNKRKNWFCERVFLDHGKITAPLVGFSLQYEMDLENVLRMKQKNTINFAGGPVVEMYAEKLIKYFNFLILGDVEVVLDKVLEEYEKGVEGFLKRISNIEGVYTGNKFSRASGDLDSFPYALVQPFPKEMTKDFVFGKCFMLEMERGCPFDCKFCAMKKFYTHVKFRSLENIKKIIDEGLKVNKVSRIVIYSPSFMHPNRKEILKYLISKGVRVSVPSIRAEQMDQETLELLKQCGIESLTIAPECNEELRMKLGKNVRNDQYFKFIRLCNEVGIKKLKMYIMVGVPEMTKRDLEDLAEFLLELKRRFEGTIYLSVNYFVPKPGTEYENYLVDRRNLKEQGRFIERKLTAFRIKIPSLNSSLREYYFLREK